jgi:hypothetical protein
MFRWREDKNEFKPIGPSDILESIQYVSMNIGKGFLFVSASNNLKSIKEYLDWYEFGNSDGKSI